MVNTSFHIASLLSNPGANSSTISSAVTPMSTSLAVPMSTSGLPHTLPTPQATLLQPPIRAPYNKVISNPQAQHQSPTVQNSGLVLSPSQLAMHDSIMDMERRSIRLVCPFVDGYTYSSDEMISAITSQGLPKTAIQGIGQMEKNRVWEVLFTTIEGRDRVAHLDILRIPNGTEIKVFPITGNIAHIKVFWVPLCVPNAMISQAISKEVGRRGGNIKFLSGQNQKVKDKRDNIMYESAMRIFKAEVADKNIIPHIMTINIPGRDRPTRILITVAGREPMCLKCKQIGHHRSECQTQ